MMKVLLIDNYDSYTHILADYLWQFSGRYPVILKNDSLSINDIACLEFDCIVISPGPGHPERESDFGVCHDLLLKYKHIPVLGVCLGHQGLAMVAGASVTLAPAPIHGKISRVVHNGDTLFKGIPSAFNVVRYHSLIVQPNANHENDSNGFDVIASTESDNLIMGIKIRGRNHYGLQFHPESAATEFGENIIQNFIEICRIDKQKRSVGKSKSIKCKHSAKKLLTHEIEWVDPEQIFLKTSNESKYCYWLDSAQVSKKSRYSIYGLSNNAYELRGQQVFKWKGSDKFSCNDSWFSILSEVCSELNWDSKQDNIPFKGGVVGFLGFECANLLALPIYKGGYGEETDGFFIQAENYWLFDHWKNKVFLCSVTDSISKHKRFCNKARKVVEQIARSPQPSINFYQTQTVEKNWRNELEITCSDSKESYMAKVHCIKDKLKHGETYEVMLSQEFLVHNEAEPEYIYQILRKTNPSTYSSFIRGPNFAVLSSSPECLFELKTNGSVRSEPIKGTRTVCTKKNEQVIQDLSNSEKERTELLMIIDLIRNDLAKVAEAGTTRVNQMYKVDTLPTLNQLVSVIKTKLRKDKNIVDLLHAVFPGGSITGAPKHRTMEIIRELESRRRGIYTGSIGFISHCGASHFNIAIRSLWASDKQVRFGVGGAIIADSDPEAEFFESLYKGYALLRAISLANCGRFWNLELSSKKEDFAATNMGVLPDEDQLESFFKTLL